MKTKLIRAYLDDLEKIDAVFYEKHDKRMKYTWAEKISYVLLRKDDVNCSKKVYTDSATEVENKEVTNCNSSIFANDAIDESENKEMINDKHTTQIEEDAEVLESEALNDYDSGDELYSDINNDEPIEDDIYCNISKFEKRFGIIEYKHFYSVLNKIINFICEDNNQDNYVLSIANISGHEFDIVVAGRNRTIIFSNSSFQKNELNSFIVSSTILNGLEPNQYFKIFKTFSHCGRNFFFDVQREVVAPFVQHYFNQSILRAISEECNHKNILIGSDARHGCRKNSSNNTLVVVGMNSNKIIGCLYASKKEIGVAQKAETVLTKKFIDIMSENGFISRIDEWVHDSNPSVSKLVEEAKINNSLDFWHVRKSIVKLFTKALKKVKKEKKIDLYLLVKSLKTHIFRCINSSSGRWDDLWKMFQNILRHWCNDHTNCSNTCKGVQQRILKEEEKEYLLKNFFEKERVKKLMYSIKNGRSTCVIESFNNKIIKFCSKRIHYSSLTYKMRIQIAVLEHNNFYSDISSLIEHHIVSKATYPHFDQFGRSLNCLGIGSEVTLLNEKQVFGVGIIVEKPSFSSYYNPILFPTSRISDISNPFGAFDHDIYFFVKVRKIFKIVELNIGMIHNSNQTLDQIIPIEKKNICKFSPITGIMNQIRHHIPFEYGYKSKLPLILPSGFIPISKIVKKVISGRKNNKKYQCWICNDKRRKYTTIEQLHRHTNHKHSEKEIILENVKEKCNV